MALKNSIDGALVAANDLVLSFQYTKTLGA